MAGPGHESGDQLDALSGGGRSWDHSIWCFPAGRLRHTPRPRLSSARATSAGGIVVQQDAEGPQIVLGKRRREGDGVTWSLPKGTPNGDESIEETALREVTEETGLQVRIRAPVGAIEYYFVQSGRRIHKTVHYFLMEQVGGDLDDHDHEFEEVRWFHVAEAEQIMSFASEREIVAKALPLAGIA